MWTLKFQNKNKFSNHTRSLGCAHACTHTRSIRENNICIKESRLVAMRYDSLFFLVLILISLHMHTNCVWVELQTYLNDIHSIQFAFTSDNSITLNVHAVCGWHQWNSLEHLRWYHSYTDTLKCVLLLLHRIVGYMHIVFSPSLSLCFGVICFFRSF